MLAFAALELLHMLLTRLDGIKPRLFEASLVASDPRTELWSLAIGTFYIWRLSLSMTSSGTNWCD